MTIGTYGQIGERRIKLKRKLVEFRELRELESRNNNYDKALEVFESLDSKEISSLKTFFVKRFPGCNPDDIRETRRDSVKGWRVHEVEAAFNDMVLNDVMKAAAEAEGMKPPWVLSKCVLTAASRQRGKGNAVLTFTGVSK
ncbi:hypothetical protein BVX97_03690 [bacterium E08(2017)]|nr:hypothetical protein BVX97_03690 [bacterium E08(2017)]